MPDDPAQLLSLVIALRVGERVVLSLIVILLALICTLGFWRSLQKVDFSLARDKLSGSASVVLATPVFALLALIAFAWVSFSNPISITPPAPAPAPGALQTAAAPSFIGATPTAEAPVTEFERGRTAEMIRALNCVASRAPQDTTTDRFADALDLIRLSLMEPVWHPDWGEPADFRAITLGLSTDPANPDAAAFATQIHPLC